MQAEGTLELFAELFIAFAGFTGLAGVLLRSEGETTGLRQELRLLIEYSLVFLVLSVVPLVLFHAGLAEGPTWRLGCAYSAAQTVAYYSVRFSSLREWAESNGTLASFFWPTVVFELVVAVLLLLAALQVTPFSAQSLYLVHLLLGLIGAALSFGRLVKPIWQSSESGRAA